MNVFSRFIDIVNANINAALDKAEDPEKMLRLMIQEMEDAVIELKSSCASDMASKLSYEHKANELEKEENRWEARARLAVSHSKDDLAREAIAARHEAAKERESCAACIGRLTDAITREKEELASHSQQLARQQEALSSHVENLTREKEEIIARAEHLTREKAELSSRTEDLTREKESLANRVEFLSKEKDSLDIRSRQLDAEKESLSKDVESLHQEKEALEREKSALSLESRSLKKRAEELETETKELAKENQQLRNQSAALLAARLVQEKERAVKEETLRKAAASPAAPARASSKQALPVAAPHPAPAAPASVSSPAADEKKPVPAEKPIAIEETVKSKVMTEADLPEIKVADPVPQPQELFDGEDFLEKTDSFIGRMKWSIFREDR